MRAEPDEPARTFSRLTSTTDPQATGLCRADLQIVDGETSTRAMRTVRASWTCWIAIVKSRLTESRLAES